METEKEQEVKPTKKQKSERRNALKHHKQKKNESFEDDDSQCEDVDVEMTDIVDADTSSTTPIPTPSPVSNSPTASTSKASSLKKSQSITVTPATNKKSSRKRRDSGTSSEEERWLTAIESGKLEDVDDELKKIKNPKLMTARQRAMYERTVSDKDSSEIFGSEVEALMSLPVGYREREKPQTAEDIQKLALKNQRRKQQADEKREKDKKKTMERLLKKQETTKQRTGRSKNKLAAAAVPMVRYQNTVDGAFIHLPVEMEFPMQPQKPREPPKVRLCGIVGCGKPKVYNCSKTNMPLCSYACYRKNVDSIREIMC